MRAGCRAEDGPHAWVAQIARNEAFRSLGRASPDPLEDEGGAIHGIDDERLASAADRLDLRGALAGLNAMDRALVWLRYEGDLTQPAIAERLGMPEGTVKVRLHRLRAALRREIDPT